MSRRGVFLFLLISFCSFSALSYAEDPSLTIQAAPDQNTAKLGMMFLTRVRVVNSSADTTTGFWVNTCSYEKHWMTDDPGVFIQSWTCNENTLEEITLEPGDAYEKNIILYISQQGKTGPVDFRLGFKRMSENGDIAEPLWSDTVTMNVVVPDDAQDGALSGAEPDEDPVPQDDIATVEAPDPVLDRNDSPDNDVNPAIAKKIP